MLDVVAGKIAATGAAGMRPLRYDIVTDPLPPSRFDLVVSAMTLHHLPDTEAALRTFVALLRDEAAVLCLADLDAEDGSFHSARSDLHHGFDRDLLASRPGVPASAPSTSRPCTRWSGRRTASGAGTRCS